MICALRFIIIMTKAAEGTKSERKRPQISHQYLSSHIKKPSQKKIASHKNPADSILSNLVDDKMQK
jgi:hypothetical protein